MMSRQHNDACGSTPAGLLIHGMTYTYTPFCHYLAHESLEQGQRLPQELHLNAVLHPPNQPF